MSANTKIEWTDTTWNPILGCSRVSEGCRNCYAEGIAGRFGNGKETVYSGLTQIVNGRPVWTGKIVETRQLLQPLSWKRITLAPAHPPHGTIWRPRRIFVNSMSDLFHENVTDEQRDRIFAVMALAPHHVYQVLTKRPKRMLEYFATDSMARLREALIGKAAMDLLLGPAKKWATCENVPVFEWSGLPMPNVWLGVSCENQATADERIPLLLETPAAVRFLSCEPLLGPIDFRKVPTFNRIGLDLSNWWIIVGGESGPHARPMHPDWAREVRDQCQAAGVPFFFKQWGEYKNGSDFKPDAIAVLDDGRTCDGTVGELKRLDREKPIERSGVMMRKVGKKAAGAMLDDREWREFPSVVQST